MESALSHPQSRKGFSAWLKHWMFRTGIDPFTYLVRLIIILLMVVFFIVPLVWLFVATTKTNDQLIHMPSLAIGSIGYIKKAWDYIMLFYYGVVTHWIYNSFYYVVCGLILSMFTAIPAGFALAVINFRGRKWLLWLTLLVMLVPGDALVLPMYIELFYMKMIDTQWALIIPAASYPVGVYLVFQYYKATLSADIIGAARVDGCSDLQLFWHIGLPLAQNIIGVLGFTNFAALWSNFFAANLFIDNTYLKTLPAGISVFVSSCSAIIPGPIPCIHSPDGHYIGRAEVALLGVISTLPVLIVYALAQRMVIRGQTSGAIKE